MKQWVAWVALLCMMLGLAGGALAAEEKTYEDKITLTWAYPYIPEGVNYGGDAFGQYWQDKFNVVFDVIPLSGEAWVESLRIWINAGDMPDLACWDFYTYNELVNYADQELVYRFPDGWEDRWPNIAKMQSYVPAAAAVMENLGGTYLLLRPAYSVNKPMEKLTGHQLIYLRKDWLQAVDVELKDVYTIDEITQIARLFKEKDPGGAGKGLRPISISPPYMGNVLPVNTFTHSSIAPYYMDESGQYVWGPADERTLEGLRIYKQWYDEGLMDPEFYTLQSMDEQYRFTFECNVGIISAYGSSLRMDVIKRELAGSGLDYDKVVHAAQLVGNDGWVHQQVNGNYWASVIFSPTISDEKFERAMDIIEYSTTLEAQELSNMGFRDIDWTLDENGDYLMLHDEIGTKYPSRTYFFYGMLCLDDDFVFVSPVFPKEFREASNKFYVQRDALTLDPEAFLDIDWNLAYYGSTAMSQASMSLTDEYAQLILMDGDLETNWKNWVSEKMKVVQPVLDELNAKFAE